MRNIIRFPIRWKRITLTSITLVILLILELIPYPAVTVASCPVETFPPPVLAQAFSLAQDNQTTRHELTTTAVKQSDLIVYGSVIKSDIEKETQASFNIYTFAVNEVIKGKTDKKEIIFKTNSMEDQSLSASNREFSLSTSLLAGFRVGKDGYYYLIDHGVFWCKSETISSAIDYENSLGNILKIMLDNDIPVSLSHSEWPPIPTGLVRLPDNITLPNKEPIKKQIITKESISGDGLKTLTEWYTWFNEGFENENSFQNNWTVDGVYPMWDREDYRSYNDEWGVWCAGDGLDPEYSNYSNNMNTWMTAGPFDLTDSNNACLDFYYWILSQTNHDFLTYSVSTNGVDFYGYSISGDNYGWFKTEWNLSLVSDGEGGYLNMNGESRVWIRFRFTSDSSVTTEGAYLDNIALEGNANSPRIDSISPSSGAAGIGQVIEHRRPIFRNRARYQRS